MRVLSKSIFFVQRVIETVNDFVAHGRVTWARHAERLPSTDVIMEDGFVVGHRAPGEEEEDKDPEDWDLVEHLE